MINFVDRAIELEGTGYHWTHSEVWFQTPKGVTVTLEEALNVVNSMDIDPQLGIRPVPVAVCRRGTEILAHEVMG